MAGRMRRSVEEWVEWVRPYVVRKTYKRRKNQYDSSETESYCYSVGVVPFGLMMDHKVSKHIKWVVVGKCEKCGKEFTSNWSNIWIRKAFRGQEVCGRCGRKEQFTEGWRLHNSEAQKKVQGTVEARKRMSKILKETWSKDTTIRTRISSSLVKAYDGNDVLRKKIGDASRRNWKRVEYQEKVTGHGYHHGWFISRCGRVYFASSWELMFLVWCENNSDVVKFGRCEDSILYEKPSGGIAYYHPDFQIKIDEKTTVVEVKGGRSELDLVERKRQAAVRFYDDLANYVMIYKSDLKRMGIFRESKTIQGWIEKMVVAKRVEEYGFGKKHS